MRRPLFALTALSLACALAVAADTLELRDGRVIEGKYKGGTAEMLHFEIDGVLHGVPVTDVVSVDFPGRPGGPTGPAAQQAPAAPAAARVAAGTRLRIRLSDTLDPRTNTPGDSFDGALEMELQANGTTIVASGSPVFGKITGFTSSGGFSLELSGLQIGETAQPIVTGSQQSVGGPGGGPAAPAPAADRLAAGTLLEFRLLQPFDVRLR
ncbi:MAG TPA: hypothetical protein VMV01_09050 [Planctomycetota bacterium]|nr:hypothetical protein [Planctomycetota bacterium]